MPDLPLRLTELDGSTRMDRITDVVLDLLFDLTQQTARFVVGPDPWRSLTVHDPFELTQAIPFGSVADPWASLAVYDADGFAPFIRGGQA
ncbi:hypothetical protein JIX56_19880 [Streptomyces sp. CA-210063]|uniref:hypothetical protein n=1 Tax=Streptomyces sp. CA-210063 TaxID=2801029 RepID=UPI00214CD639|nr:hypothetical protein [Streptomyces sp. CA-210063]UUU31981.1 hypothetical protein JIX56_19880 [Streptomyces sp. CA-210063]